MCSKKQLAKPYSSFAPSSWSLQSSSVDNCVGVVKLIGTSRFSGVIHIIPNCLPAEITSH